MTNADEESYIASAAADLRTRLAELSPAARRQNAERRLTELRPKLTAARETLAGAERLQERDPMKYGAAMAGTTHIVQDLETQIAAQERIVHEVES